jgi:hypothetical protein
MFLFYVIRSRQRLDSLAFLQESEGTVLGVTEEEEVVEETEWSSKCTDSTVLTRTNLGTTLARGKFTRRPTAVLVFRFPFFLFFPLSYFFLNQLIK